MATKKRSVRNNINVDLFCWWKKEREPFLFCVLPEIKEVCMTCQKNYL